MRYNLVSFIFYSHWMWCYKIRVCWRGLYLFLFSRWMRPNYIPSKLVLGTLNFIWNPIWIGAREDADWTPTAWNGRAAVLSDTLAALSLRLLPEFEWWMVLQTVARKCFFSRRTRFRLLPGSWPEHETDHSMQRCGAISQFTAIDSEASSSLTSFPLKP